MLYLCGYLCGYYELEGLPHHSSDVFFHGESISDRFTCVWTLYRSITWPLMTLCCVVQPKIRCNSVEIYGKSMKINEIQWKSMKINDISENSPLCSGFVMSVTHSSRWIECPNTRKSIGNGFPMKKYVGAVVRKSFQLVIAAEIDHSENKSPV